MTPPRRAERLLQRLIVDPRLEDAVLGDLAEEWAERAARDGERAANRWYWRQAVRTLPHLLAARRRQSSTQQNGDGVMRTGISWLDLKLGARMLVKHPGLTFVGGLAIAVAVAIGGAWFEFSHDYFYPTLPLDEGERVVGILNWDAAANEPDYGSSLHDFTLWRSELRSVRDLGAFRTPDRNLITADGRAEPVNAAEISASAFRLVRVPPLLGRGLIAADEQEGAPPVAVIGYDLWQTRFGGDSGVVGRIVQLGTERSTIVGVMPPGFAFPVNQSLWLPLRLRASDYQRGADPPVRIFGRLAPGVTLDEAQAELTAIGRRVSADFPLTNEHVRPRVMPYVSSLFGDMNLPWINWMRALFGLIFLVPCANVATLVFARTSTREREIAVRRALGASRGRIVAQLFAEAFVLAAVASTIGLLVVWWGQGWGIDIVRGAAGGGDTPFFWWDTDLSLGTVLYVGGLTTLAATVVGVLPALKATSGRVRARLQQTADGGSGMRFGVVSTGVIVVQVALSVLVLPEAANAVRESLRFQADGLGFPAHEYLGARLMQDGPVAPNDSAAATAFLTRFRATYRELEQRLRAEPGVAGVTVATSLPGTEPGQRPEIEVEGLTIAPVHVNAAAVDVGLFDAFDAPILAGRDFDSGDVTAERDVVIVNQSFVREILDGRNPIGRRVRYTNEPDDAPEPWLEIVGVVPDLAMNAFSPGEAAGLYRPLLARTYPVQLAVRVRGDATAFTPRLRAIAAQVDPTLRLYDPRPLDESARALAMGSYFGAGALALVAAIALLLSATGIYALMSFIVAQRTREIGIRSALGANPRRIVLDILSRAFAQIGLGVALGALGVAFGGQATREAPELLVGVAVIMLAVGLLACAAPIRRALRVQPTEALKAGS